MRLGGEDVARIWERHGRYQDATSSDWVHEEEVYRIPSWGFRMTPFNSR